MDNSYFVYAENDIKIERFHICTWEFSNDKTLVEFGCEVNAESIANADGIEIKFFIPWLSSKATVTDFYSRLQDTSNSRFIFNDSIAYQKSLDGGENRNGVIQHFSGKNELCILPISFGKNFGEHKISVQVNLKIYNQFQHEQGKQKPNVYFRFCIDPNKSPVSVVKKGITRSTILYDIKLNQRRNIPEDLLNEILHHRLCTVETCFCFNIIPNTHDLVFVDNSTLKNVRTLEYQSFQKYLGEQLLKEEDLIVVFNKKEKLDSYTFFSIFTKEHIGIDQLTVALLVNLVAGILLFIASLDISLALANKSFSEIALPYTFWIVILLFGAMLIYYFIRKGNLNFTRKRKSL
ncbi:MAG: hypothetical protein EOO46_10765 [Flavobacterium sp.]|nr:MAG: hypothetical protein EOO46_10765 [Flavobacterium sp.]